MNDITPIKQDRKQTFTGHQALILEEKLIFEIGIADKTGVDFEPDPEVSNRLGDSMAPAQLDHSLIYLNFFLINFYLNFHTRIDG